MKKIRLKKLRKMMTHQDGGATESQNKVGKPLGKQSILVVLVTKFS